MTQSQVHILVVDDERNIRNNLAMVLEVEGYKVDVAGNGDEAYSKLKRAATISSSSISRCPRWMAWNCFAIYAALDPRCRWSC